MSQAEQLYILVVEDNPRNQRLVDMVLKRYYRLSLAEDGEQALLAVAEELPDLILLDIQIPKIDGLEVARRLKHDPKTRDIPIIALTSYAMPTDRERILEAGCDGYLAKPINTRTLVSDVESFLAGKGIPSQEADSDSGE